MPSNEAQLIISCKSTGTNTVNDFNKAVLRADKSSAALKKTVAGIFSSAAFFKFGKESIALFKIQEAATEGLRSALLKQGIAFNIVTDELMKFNTELQSLTIYGDEELGIIQAQGLNMGITADKIKEATKAAIGLSAAYNMKLGSAMMLIARASQGQTQMLSRYGIVLDSNLTPQEKYAQLLKIGTSNMQIATDKTKTLSGSTKQMTNIVNDAKEAIGSHFSPAIISANNTIKDLAQGFLDLKPETQRFIVLTGTLTTAMLALKTATNLKAIADGIAAKSGLVHSGSMKNLEKEAVASSKSMAVFAQYSAELRQKEVERVAIVDKVTLAQEKQKEVFEQLSNADQKVSSMYEKLAEAERAYKETGADWMRNVDNKEDYEEFRYRAKELEKLKDQMSDAQKEVVKLEDAYAGVNENLKSATKELDLFDSSRKKETDYTKNLNENIAAQEARTKVLKKTGNALKADEAAVAAHNRVVEQQAIVAKQAETAEFLRARALSMGATEAEANAVKTQYLNSVMAKSGKSTGIITKGLGAMKVGFRAAAVAAKGLMMSMLPMLAISVGLSALDWLINRKANANKAAAEIAEKEVETAKQLVAKGNEQRTLDQEKLARYQELAKYSDRSADEQKELVTLANELNSQYQGLNVPLLKQNELLEDTAGLWDDVKKKQHEAYMEEMKILAEKQQRNVRASGLTSASEMNNRWLELVGLNSYEKGVAARLRGEVINLPYEKQIERIKLMMEDERAQNNSTVYDNLNNYLKELEKLIKIQEDYSEAVKSGSTGVQGELTGPKKDKKVNEARRKSEESIEDEKWQIAFRRAEWKEQLQMLEKKRQDREKEMSLIHSRTENVKEIERRAELQREIFNIEEQIYGLNKKTENEKMETARKVLDTLTQQREAQAGIWQELFNSGRGYKETASSAIASNSEQAIRMQSRMIFSPKINQAEQAQKTTAITTENILKVLESWKKENDTLKSNVQSIAEKLGLTTY